MHLGGIQMKLVIDSSDIQKIKELNELLTVAGVTTNPTIITKSGRPSEDVINDLIDILSPDQLIFIQVVKTDFEGIMEEAKYINSLREKNMVVKIPVTHEGLKAIKECKKLGIKTLATAIYTANQGFMAALNGADYLAPYVNRMENFGYGIGQVCDLLDMLRLNNLPTEVIAASFKNTRQVHELFKAGIQSVTVPVDVAFNLIDHPATESAVETFSKDWEKAYGRNSLA